MVIMGTKGKPMREILFRGKRVDNGEWCEGDLIQLQDGRKYIVNNIFGACIDDNGNLINTEPPFVCPVDPDTVGQYTELTDMGGKRIFEGDIIRAYGANYIVRMSAKRRGWWPFACGDGCGCCENYVVPVNNAVVCANIHDNPEVIWDCVCEDT